MSFLFGRNRSSSNRKVIGRLNDDIVRAVRQPAFYGAEAVPDSFSGRFELLVLHTALVVRRLRACEEPGPMVAQDLIDMIFRHLDFSLREHGVGDMAVPKRMKRMAEAFLGRSIAYDTALREHDEVALSAAVARNVYDGKQSGQDLARYAADAAARLEGRSLDELLNGPFEFPVAGDYVRVALPHV